MPRSRFPEPCLCGDPECKRCFPGGDEPYYDETYADELRMEREAQKYWETIEDEDAPV